MTGNIIVDKPPLDLDPGALVGGAIGGGVGKVIAPGLGRTISFPLGSNNYAEAYIEGVCGGYGGLIGEKKK